MSPIFEVFNIGYTYNNGPKALSCLSMSLGESEKLAVVGANGSGKSTLLFHLIGCLAPDFGEMKYRGKNVTREVKKKLRRDVGFLFQNPDDQLFLTTVWEDVAFGPKNAGLGAADIDKNVASALEVVGISAVSGRSPWKLSGGEKTLAALAGLLATQPGALLLDEPTSSLDPAARENVIGILKKLTCSMVIATHDLDLVLEVCDRVIFLLEGKVAGESGIPGLLIDKGFMENCGLRLPLSFRET